MTTWSKGLAPDSRGEGPGLATWACQPYDPTTCSWAAAGSGGEKDERWKSVFPRPESPWKSLIVKVKIYIYEPTPLLALHKTRSVVETLPWKLSPRRRWAPAECAKADGAQEAPLHTVALGLVRPLWPP